MRTRHIGWVQMVLLGTLSLRTPMAKLGYVRVELAQLSQVTQTRGREANEMQQQ